MQAIIVAAGPGTRLRPLTDHTHKCLLTVGDGPILTYQLKALRTCGIEDIVIVTGHYADQVEAAAGSGIRFVYNPFFATTNSMGSLWFAHWLMDEEFIYMHADVLFDLDILTDLIACPHSLALSIQKKMCDEEDMKVKVINGLVTEINKTMPVEQAYGEFVGFALARGEGVQILTETMDQIMREGDHMAYFAQAIQRIADQGYRVHLVEVGNRFWVEIDTVEDLERARNLIAERRR